MTWISPVVVIGVDAATWDVLDPLLAAGKLPNIARLINDGASGRIKSLIRYPSPALWTSISTGKLPEKHGVTDFYNATRHNIRCSTVFEILDQGRGDVGYFRWFATWPADKGAKFSVPSAVARTPETHPANLGFLNQLLQPSGARSYFIGGWQYLLHGARLKTLTRAITEIIYEIIVNPEQCDWHYRRRLIEAAIYGDVFNYLLREYKPQFAAILFFHADDLSHRYWKYREPQSFREVSEGEISKYGKVIEEAYIETDTAIGGILKSIPDDATVIVISDHGQQAGSSWEVPYRISHNLLRYLGFEDRVYMTNIGYSTSFRSQSGRDDRQALNELCVSLERVKLTQNGRSVFKIILDEPEDITAEVNFGPEIDINEIVTCAAGKYTILGDWVFSDGQLSGIHSEWGILIMKGPGIRRGYRFEDATILDMTPTILALRSIPIGEDMDGQVITEAISQDFLEEHPLQYIASYDAKDKEEQDITFSPRELEELEARLRNLGYLG